ncbi:MAG TPA: 23S rRNA (guanosine(2251)-2'-O)-methyltransferase RlmB [Pyrinomonadaceae bacterium]|nr:23S rRNA (guanosine(2251)-2'-O)-methyltransferase RlmB [Pyrinomonadaceae bacterium]
MKRRGGNNQNPWRPAKWDERAGVRDARPRVGGERDEARGRDESVRAQDVRGLAKGGRAQDEHGRAKDRHARAKSEHSRQSPGERVARAFASGGRPERKASTDDRDERTKRSPASQSSLASNSPSTFSSATGDGAHVFGVQPVLEALRARARPVERVTVAEGAHESRLHEIIELARGAGVPVRRAPRAELQRIAPGVNHQGVVATISAARYTSADVLLEALAARVGTDEPPLAVVLDGVEDPRNLGAVIRTVECAGAHGVFVPERRASGLTETVAKAAAGALEYVPVARAVNLARLVEDLKGRGLWAVGTASDAATTYTEWDWTQPCALLLGGEGEGLRRLVRERCDALVSIPLLGKIESLNVSVAAGIILYEAVRQRTARRAGAYNERRNDE